MTAQTPAAAKSTAGAVFAALLAKVNPNASPASSSLPQTHAAITPSAQDGGDKKLTTSQDSPNSDIAAALAAMQAVTPQPAQPPAPPKNADAVSDAIKDGTKPFADLKAVDPAQLRAALTQPVPPQAPGAPTLPVMPPHGDEDGDEPALAKDFAVKDAMPLPDVAKAAQHLLRPATPAQATEAQTLPVKFDAKQDGQNAGTNGQGTQDGSQDRPRAPANAPTAAQQTQSTPPAVHAQATPPAEVKTIQPGSAPTAISGITPAQPTQASQATAAALHVAQASHDAPQPDIAALAVSIAAKSQAGEKHFEIRLDPPEMGRIDVRLSVDDAGKAQAHLSADKPQTLDMLQRDSGTLTRALKESGIDLGNTGLQFSLRGQDRDGGPAPKSFARGRALSVSAVADTSAISTSSVASDNARLDIRV